MTPPARPEDNDNEGTPLLFNDDPPLKPTPLPATQVSVLTLPWIAEAVVVLSISPYINQLVRDLPIVGGDGRKVGYYTGIIVSSHYVAEAITAFYWNRLSDHIGRKPVLLCCLAGTTASMILFGLSRSFSTIVISRCLHGALKGNIGVVKSAMAELTDESNVARGFSSLQMAWSIGYVIGPLIGGALSRPQDRWPHIFTHPFWANYPYFLPCLVVAVYCSMSWVIVAMFLEEVRPSLTLKERWKEDDTQTMLRTPRPARIISDISQEESGDTIGASQKDAQKPPPLRSLLTRPVLISIANHSMIALLETGSLALIPLVWSTPVKFGGLDLSPASIGLCMSAFGCVDGIFQFTVFPRAVGRFGLRRVFATCIVACAVVIIMFPLENVTLRHIMAIGGSTMVVWPLIFVQLLSFSTHRMGFSATMIYVSSATPSKRSLGAVNGISRLVSSVQSAIGPAVADSLFAFSVTNNVLGGNFAYVVLLTLVCVGLYIAAKLPRHLWTHIGR